MIGGPVIIDTDSLIHLAYLDSKYPILQGMRQLVTSIHVPDKVTLEFYHNALKNPERQKIITQLEFPRRFIRKCTEFDLLELAFLSSVRGIDEGEASAVAQYNKINARYIISEDGRFANKLTGIRRHIKIIKLKHILAMLDLVKFIDWNGCVKLLYERRHFTVTELRDAYLYVAKQSGINVTKEILSEKTSLKRIGIKPN